MTSPSKEAKVAQLAGYCGEHTAYHHGEASLISTIVNMAQSYVGSSNLPLLYPSGQFGTRLQGGKDAASARYIYHTSSRTLGCYFLKQTIPYSTTEKMRARQSSPRTTYPSFPPCWSTAQWASPRDGRPGCSRTTLAMSLATLSESFEASQWRPCSHGPGASKAK